MKHLDPEIIALLALGESAATDAQLEHLLGCTLCTAQLRQLELTASVGRRALGEGQLIQPDDRVWRAIAAEVGVDVEPVTIQTRAVVDHLVVRRRRRPSRRLATLAAAIAVVIAVAITGSVVVAANSAPRTLASATLEPLPAWKGASGTAVVEKLPGGDRVVHVTVSMKSNLADIHEVWLMTTETSNPISLGTLTGLTGSFDVPDGLNLGTYSIVSVSDLPRDAPADQTPSSVMLGKLS